MKHKSTRIETSWIKGQTEIFEQRLSLDRGDVSQASRGDVLMLSYFSGPGSWHWDKDIVVDTGKK